MRKNSHVIGIVILSLSAVLILFGIHRLETIQAAPEYKVEQILAQYGWSASQFNDFTSRSSQISKGFQHKPSWKKSPRQMPPSVCPAIQTS